MIVKVPGHRLEAARTENGDTLIFDDSTKDLMTLRVPANRHEASNGVKMGSESGLRRPRPSESLSRASWSALGASWSREKEPRIALGRSWGALGAASMPQTPRVKPDYH